MVEIGSLLIRVKKKWRLERHGMETSGQLVPESRNPGDNRATELRYNRFLELDGERVYLRVISSC